MTFRLSRHVKMDRGVSLTCPQKIVRVELVQFGERHDKRTNGQNFQRIFRVIFLERTCSLWQAERGSR